MHLAARSGVGDRSTSPACQRRRPSRAYNACEFFFFLSTKAGCQRWRRRLRERSLSNTSALPRSPTPQSFDPHQGRLRLCSIWSSTELRLMEKPVRTARVSSVGKDRRPYARGLLRCRGSPASVPARSREGRSRLRHDKDFVSAVLVLLLPSGRRRRAASPMKRLHSVNWPSASLARRW
jgi:hypothetical protein